MEVFKSLSFPYSLTCRGVKPPSPLVCPYTSHPPPALPNISTGPKPSLPYLCPHASPPPPSLPDIAEGPITFLSGDVDIDKYFKLVKGGHAMITQLHVSNALILDVNRNHQSSPSHDKDARFGAKVVSSKSRPDHYEFNFPMLLTCWRDNKNLMLEGRAAVMKGRSIIVRLDPEDEATSVSARIVIEQMFLKGSTIEKSVHDIRKDYASGMFRFGIDERYAPVHLIRILMVQSQKEKERERWQDLCRSLDLEPKRGFSSTRQRFVEQKMLRANCPGKKS